MKILAATPFLFSLLFVMGVAQQTGENCPLIPQCCEEDCCARGTSWDQTFCVPDPSSPGFSGQYSDEYEFGCLSRVCCEDDCCSLGTIFDPSIGCCIPEGTQSPTASPAPTTEGCGTLCSDLADVIEIIPPSPAPTEAPDTWKPYPNSGTTEDRIDQLFCYDDQGTEVKFPINGTNITLDELAKLLKDPVVGPIIEKCLNRIDKDEEDRIIKLCNMKATKLEKALCAALEIRKLLEADTGNVCRHYAFEFDQILERMGCTATLIAKSKNGDGHAWTEFMEGGKRYLMDVYNKIYICVG